MDEETTINEIVDTVVEATEVEEDPIAALTREFTETIDDLKSQLKAQQEAHEKEIKEIVMGIVHPGVKKTDFEKSCDYVIQKVNKYR